MTGSRRAGAAKLLLAALAGCASLAPTGEPFESADGWGYRTARGRVTLPARYAVALPFSPGGIAAVVDESGWAMIDRRGTVLLRPVIVDNGPDDFSESLARFVADGKVGFFNARGHIVIPARFDWAAPFHEGRSAFCQGCAIVVAGEHSSVVGGRWGYIDRQGHVVIAPRFATAEDFVGGVARVTLEGSTLSIDRDGRPSLLARR